MAPEAVVPHRSAIKLGEAATPQSYTIFALGKSRSETLPCDRVVCYLPQALGNSAKCKVDAKQGEVLSQPPGTQAKGTAICTNAAGIASYVLHHRCLP